MGNLEGWKEKLLNQAGKEVLIKAVVQAIPSYVMSIVKFPKGFCKRLCSMGQDFADLGMEEIEASIGRAGSLYRGARK